MHFDFIEPLFLRDGDRRTRGFALVFRLPSKKSDGIQLFFLLFSSTLYATIFLTRASGMGLLSGN